MASEQKATEVKRRYSRELLMRPGVSGVGVEKNDKGEYVVAVHVDADNPQVGRELPSTLDGCEVKVVSSGPFRKRG